MGAEYSTAMLRDKDKKLTAKEVHTEFAEIREQCEYDYGHAGYTGTFAETPGVSVLSRHFDDWEAAFNYIEEKAEKWENALALRVEGDDPGWAIGAWCSS